MGNFGLWSRSQNTKMVILPEISFRNIFRKEIILLGNRVDKLWNCNKLELQIFSDKLLADPSVPVAAMWRESILEVVDFIFENRYWNYINISL